LVRGRGALVDRERGSVLLLLPAAVMIFLILGALAVDFTQAWSAERELANAAAAAANDAASRAVDLDYLYATGELRLLADKARFVAERSVAAAGLDRLDATVVDVEVVGLTVRVTVRGRAHYLFGPAVPGGPEGADVEASASVMATVPAR
jgi:Flp pilus assembly protein TadG